MQTFAVCFFIYNISLNLIVGLYYWSDKIEPMFHEQLQQDIHILAILGNQQAFFYFYHVRVCNRWKQISG